MKDVFIGSVALVIVYLLVVFGVDFLTTVDCDKIPKNQKYKYAVLSDNEKKCVRLSNKEIRENEMERLEEENAELKEKYCIAINYNTDECKRFKELKERLWGFEN